MRIFILILFMVFLNSSLKADGFYIGGSMGVITNGNIKISNLNKQKSFLNSTITHNDETFIGDGDWNATRIIRNNEYLNNYSSTLKEMAFKSYTKSPTISLNSGFAFKNMRVEGELRFITLLKVKPKNSLYDVALQQDYKNNITFYCTKNSNNQDCYENAHQVDKNSPEWKNCPSIPGVSSTECYVRITTTNSTNYRNFNNIVVDNEGNPIFSPDVDKEVFYNKNTSTTANSSLLFMNFLYELPLSQSFTIFTGIGLGYGLSLISSNNIVGSKQVTYPAYQYKFGMYYSITSYIDITVNYADINAIESLKYDRYPIKATRFQSVDIGVRYNLFNKDPGFYNNYNYKKIFSLP